MNTSKPSSSVAHASNLFSQRHPQDKTSHATPSASQVSVVCNRKTYRHVPDTASIPHAYDSMSFEDLYTKLHQPQPPAAPGGATAPLTRDCWGPSMARQIRTGGAEGLPSELQEPRGQRIRR